MEHADRYARAREFYDVVTGLWDTWADDAFVRDAASGDYFDPERLHVLGHAGPHFSVRGPLHIARPVQGWPVIVQAGASEAGRQLAAETAEVVFAAHGTLEEGQRFYADVKGRMRSLGRDPDHLKILPGAFVVVADTMDEARAIRARLDALVHYDSAISSLSVALGSDVSHLDPDGPLPDSLPESNASKSGRERVMALARRENLTVRQLAQRLGGLCGPVVRGNAPQHCRRDAAMAGNRCSRWLQRHVSVAAWRAGCVRGQAGARVAGAWPAAPRIRGHDPTRKPGAATPAEPVFHAPVLNRVCVSEGVSDRKHVIRESA